MRRASGFLILIVLIAMVGGVGAAQSLFNYSLAVAVVTMVIDGDTFDVEYLSGGEGLPTRVELYLINAPENVAAGPFTPPNKECYGPESTEFAENYLLNRVVWLRHQERISEFAFIERLHALMFLDSDEQSLYQAIALSQGMARQEVRYSEEQIFFPRVIKLTKEAEDARRGLWGSCS